MKRLIITLAILIAATTFVFGQSKDEQEIRKMFEMTANALAKNDIAALSNYYADDLTFTVADGRMVNKTQFLEFVKNSKREAFNFDDLTVRTFGNTAVVNFNRTSTNVDQNGSKMNSKSRDTAVLVKNGGRWQIVALQISDEMAKNETSAEQEIRQTLDKMADALTRRDADAMANYWADNHTFTNRNGVTQNKAQRLASLKSGQPRPGAFKYEDVGIRLLGGNAAVVSARPTFPIKFDNGQTITVSDRATMTMAKMNGRWQIVATHSSWDNPGTGDDAAVEKQLDEILTNWGNAAGRRDAAAIDKILAGDFIVKAPNGTIQTRAQYLEAAKNFPGDATVTGKASKTLVEGETAVSMGTYSVTPKAGGQAVNYNYTATFVRRMGRWLPISFYSSATEQK